MFWVAGGNCVGTFVVTTLVGYTLTLPYPVSYTHLTLPTTPYV